MTDATKCYMCGECATMEAGDNLDSMQPVCDHCANNLVGEKIVGFPKPIPQQSCDYCGDPDADYLLQVTKRGNLVIRTPICERCYWDSGFGPAIMAVLACRGVGWGI